VALLGPNGAGKTTLVNTLVGLLRPTAGRVAIDGADPQRAQTRKNLGVMLQSVGFPRTLKVGELVSGWAVRAGKPRATASAVLDEVGIADLSARRTHKLSGGQQQRLQLAMALVADPILLVLDEPTAGLDIASRRAFWNILAARRARGAAVLLTTHQIDEAAATADRVIVLHQGRVVASDRPIELTSRLPDRSVSARTTLDTAYLRSLPGVISVTHDAGRVHLATSQAEAAVRELLNADSDLRDLRVEAASLEPDGVAAVRAVRPGGRVRDVGQGRASGAQRRVHPDGGRVRAVDTAGVAAGVRPAARTVPADLPRGGIGAGGVARRSRAGPCSHAGRHHGGRGTCGQPDVPFSSDVNTEQTAAHSPTAARRRWGINPRWYLIYLGNLYFQPAFDPTATAADWALAITLTVLGAALCLVGMHRTGRSRLAATVAVTLLGVTAVWFNAGASVFFVYAAALAGTFESRTHVQRWHLGLSVVLVLLALASPVPMPWRLMVFGLPLLFIWVIGAEVMTSAEQEREAARLRIDNARIEHLATLGERERIARDLHDLLGHTLTGVVVRAQLIRRLADSDPDRVAREASGIEQIARDALTEVRSAVSGWRHHALDSEIEVARAALATMASAPWLQRARDWPACVSASRLWAAGLNAVSNTGPSAGRPCW
jgi:ABC-2 type transport system ATP-binding protein